MIAAGVDPGQSGALTVLEDDGTIRFMSPWEDIQAFVMAMEQLRQSAHVFLEKAQAMSRGGQSQGVKSVFTYAEHFGTLQGVLIALRIPHTLVPPLAWQKQMFIGTAAGKPAKERALKAAQRLQPGLSFLASPRCKRPHDGMIDSFLIAEYGRRLLGGKAPVQESEMEKILKEAP